MGKEAQDTPTLEIEEKKYEFIKETFFNSLSQYHQEVYGEDADNESPQFVFALHHGDNPNDELYGSLCEWHTYKEMRAISELRVGLQRIGKAHVQISSSKQAQLIHPELEGARIVNDTVTIFDEIVSESNSKEEIQAVIGQLKDSMIHEAPESLAMIDQLYQDTEERLQSGKLSFSSHN